MNKPARDDLVERLVSVYTLHDMCGQTTDNPKNPGCLMHEAADEITRLRKELAEAREECARVADMFAEKYGTRFRGKGGLFVDQQACYISESIAANIRALNPSPPSQD